MPNDSDRLDLAALVDVLLDLNDAAMARILEVYGRTDLGVETKTDDSPVTAADHAADEVLTGGLRQLTPDIPVVSEEREPPAALRDGSAPPRFWLVDPLDGTREFIDRNGEFTTNVALVEDGRPVLGIVGLPVTGEVFVGVAGLGAFHVSGTPAARTRRPIAVRALGSSLRVLASRRVGGEATARFLARCEARFDEVTLVQAGSALKLCRVAEGAADAYARPGPTCWWDTAAAQAVVEAAGGAVWCWGSSEPMRYRPAPGKFDPLNPHFLVVADPTADWVGLMAED